MGPLAAALPIDNSAFSALSTYKKVNVIDPREGLFYEARDPVTDIYHSVVIVGYYDRSDSTGLIKDRSDAFWICRSSWGEGGTFGYNLRLEGSSSFHSSPGAVTNLFNVPMNSSEEGLSLSLRVLSFDRIMIQRSAGIPRSIPSSVDPMVSPYGSPLTLTLTSLRYKGLEAMSDTNSDQLTQPPAPQKGYLALILFVVFAFFVARMIAGTTAASLGK